MNYRFRLCGGSWTYCDGECENCPANHTETSDHTTPTTQSYSTTTEVAPYNGETETTY